MRIVFIFGPVASGKLTIARELARLTGLPVFHNHLVVDAVSSVFEFGSPAFVELRQRWWLEMFRKAAEEDRSIIFTFTPESSVPATFVDEVRKQTTSLGSQVLFVRLTCSREEQERRIESPSRAEFRKLRSVDMLRKVRKAGGEAYSSLPETDLTIDTEMVVASAAAELIRAFFNLPSSGSKPAQRTPD